MSGLNIVCKSWQWKVTLLFPIFFLIPSQYLISLEQSYISGVDLKVSIEILILWLVFISEILLTTQEVLERTTHRWCKPAHLPGGVGNGKWRTWDCYPRAEMRCRPPITDSCGLLAPHSDRKQRPCPSDQKGKITPNIFHIGHIEEAAGADYWLYLAEGISRTPWRHVRSLFLLGL